MVEENRRTINDLHHRICIGDPGVKEDVLAVDGNWVVFRAAIKSQLV